MAPKKKTFYDCFVALERPYLWFFCSLKSGNGWQSYGLRRFSSNSLYIVNALDAVSVGHSLVPLYDSSQTTRKR
jgi:hypothetical protein